MKKTFAILLSLVLMLSLAVPAMADGTTPPATTYTITINNTVTGHTYEAYQIFKGDLSSEADDDASAGTEAVLSNIQWGDNITPATFIEKLKEAFDHTDIDGLANDASAATVAEKLVGKDAAKIAECAAASKKGAAAGSDDFDENKYEITGLTPGYYLVMDAAAVTGHDAKTSYIIEVVENSTVTPKVAKPTVDKQVWDETGDAETGSTDGWGETADHAINETFEFKLIATLDNDADFAAYEKYKIVFTDTMSAGITFEEIVRVTVDGQPVQPGEGDNQYKCTAEANQKGGTWTLTIKDIKGIAKVDLNDGAIVEVIYKAHLNEDAKIENEKENKNTVNLQYSNNPNAGGESELGKTPDDHVWVFTYKMENKKVDGGKQPLAGAGFKLYADEGCQTEIPVIYDNGLGAYRLVKSGETGVQMTSAETTGVFNIVGLDVGTYYLKETLTPAGYNTCPVVKVEITATHAEDASKETATTTITMKQDGTVTNSNEIINNQGTVLPETGGMGTTIFYIVGGVMVAAAVVLLITKKRMSAEG